MNSHMTPTRHSLLINSSQTFSPPLLPSSQTTITVGLAFGAFLMLAGAYFFAKRKKLPISIINIQDFIKKILPKGESIQKIKEMAGGFSNNLWQVDTNTRSYIFRSPKEKIQPSNFSQILKISKLAFQNGISPQVFGENLDHEQMLLEYIQSTPWPTYEENFSPYKATMKILKCFHEKIPFDLPQNKESYAPFTFIFNESDTFENSPDLPIHLSVALKKIEIIYERLKPSLQNHATPCHGDFHQGNILLTKGEMMTPLIIDFDTTSNGDPIYDVVKFSVSLLPKQRQILFFEYLGGRPPTSEEEEHFELMDLVLLVVIACGRFKSAQNAKGSFQERLLKDEMEDMLNSKEPLPSFRKIPFRDTSPKARQLGAVYALGEFIKRYEALPFIRHS